MSTINRRQFVMGGAALLGAAPAPFAAMAQTDPPILRALPSTAQLAPAGYPRTPVWSYAIGAQGVIPGPEIRVKAGARVRYRLENALPQPTAVHWHGIRIANAMDGAAPLTQEPVAPGDHFLYDFEAPDPGTYWYHSHNYSTEQVARGLAGPLIVEDRAPWLGQTGAAQREMTLVIDDWLLDPEAAIVENRWDNLHDAAHAGRLGNTVTVNGTAYPEISVRPGERVRVRLINTATARVMLLGLPDLAAHLIALDGHPAPPQGIETIELGPAQRADIVIDAPHTEGRRHPLLLDPGNGNWVDIAGFAAAGPPRTPATADVRPLPSWASLPSPDLTQAQREPLLMEGGAMRGLREARFRGETLDGRALAARGMVWAFNGVAHQMADPMFRTTLGRTVHVTMTNRTAFAHAIHLHGHHFHVIATNGVAPPYPTVRDTVLVGREETVEVAFVADNPGRWMLHCHMLSHQASGMMGWYEVS